MAKKELKEFKASGEDSSVMDPVAKGNNSRAKDNNAIRMGKADKVKPVTPGESGNPDDMIDDKPKSVNNKRSADKVGGEKMSKLKEMVGVLSRMSPEDLEELHSEMVSEDDAQAASVIEVVREDFEKLFSEDDLSEDFKKKFFTLVEAAVITKVLEETSQIQEDSDVKLEAAIEEAKEDLADKVDGYLNQMTEEWAEDNKVEIENNSTVALAESFMDGLRKLYEDHNVDLPEEAVNVVESLEADKAELEKAFDEIMAENIEMKDVIEDLIVEETVSEMSDDLTESQKDKFLDIAENIEYSGIEDLQEKLETVKESITGTKTESKTAEQSLNEEYAGDPAEDKIEVDSQMQAYINKAVSSENQL